MISLTRLSGSVFLLNADLIERVDSTPDTVVTLVDGKKYVVAESMGDVLEAVVAYRGEIVALGALLDSARAAQQSLPLPRRENRTGPRLAAVAPHPTARLQEDAEPGDRTGGDL
jgi:flagellar protein FlbD